MAKRNSTKAPSGVSVERLTPQRAQQLLTAISDTVTQVAIAKAVAQLVIDSLPPMENARIAYALEGVTALLDLAERSAVSIETYALTVEREVSHA